MKRMCVILGLAMAAASFGIFPNNTEPSFQSVGKVGDVDGAGNFFTNGSAVVIAPRWALTAAHVTGSRFETEGVRYTIVQKITHVGTSGNNADLALIRLSADCPFTTPVLYRPFSGTDGLSGRVCKLVGQGATASMINRGWSLTGSSSGTRRSSVNVIDALYTNLQVQVGTQFKRTDYLVFDLDNWLTENNGVMGQSALPGEGGIIVKDSGGGMFVQEGSNWFLVGIHGLVGTISGTGVTDPYFWGGIGLSAHLQPYEQWINQTIGP